MYYVYILFSHSANIYYVGYSADPWNRLIQHLNNSPDTFTGKYQDWGLKAVFEVSDQRSDAVRIEKFIKKQKSRKLIESLIDSTFVPMGILAPLVRVPHVRD